MCINIFLIPVTAGLSYTSLIGIEPARVLVYNKFYPEVYYAGVEVYCYIYIM